MNPLKLLREYVAAVSGTDEPDTWHVLGMLVKMREMYGSAEQAGKFNRWLGFVQGWLYAHGLRTIDQMREETRGLDEVMRTEVPSVDSHRLARVLYETYCSDRGWRTSRGDTLPQWGDLNYGRRSHWLAVADAAIAAKVVK